MKWPGPGRFGHRPGEGEFAQKYGENIAWGTGGGYDVLTAARFWYEEKKSYTPGTPIPRDFRDFKAGHYTQMVWKDTTEIGAGKAVIQAGDRKGSLFVVCNYNPRGNIVGEKPFLATGIGRGRDARGDDPEVAKLQAKVERLEKENAELRKAELVRLGADTRILNHLAKAMRDRPDDRGLRSDAADLAKRLAPRFQGNRTVWEVLLETKTLEGITTVEEAEKMLGPATEKTDKRIGLVLQPSESPRGSLPGGDDHGQGAGGVEAFQSVSSLGRDNLCPSANPWLPAPAMPWLASGASPRRRCSAGSASCCTGSCSSASSRTRCSCVSGLSRGEARSDEAARRGDSTSPAGR